MKTKTKIIEEIEELRMEEKSIFKIMNKGDTDYDVWKSLDIDLTECRIKIKTLEWVIKK